MESRFPPSTPPEQNSPSSDRKRKADEPSSNDSRPQASRRLGGSSTDSFEKPTTWADTKDKKGKISLIREAINALAQKGYEYVSLQKPYQKDCGVIAISPDAIKANSAGQVAFNPQECVPAPELIDEEKSLGLSSNHRALLFKKDEKYYYLPLRDIIFNGNVFTPTYTPTLLGAILERFAISAFVAILTQQANSTDPENSYFEVRLTEASIGNGQHPGLVRNKISSWPCFKNAESRSADELATSIALAGEIHAYKGYILMVADKSGNAYRYTQGKGIDPVKVAQYVFQGTEFAELFYPFKSDEDFNKEKCRRGIDYVNALSQYGTLIQKKRIIDGRFQQLTNSIREKFPIISFEDNELKKQLPEAVCNEYARLKIYLSTTHTEMKKAEETTRAQAKLWMDNIDQLPSNIKEYITKIALKEVYELAVRTVQQNVTADPNHLQQVGRQPSQQSLSSIFSTESMEQISLSSPPATPAVTRK